MPNGMFNLANFMVAHERANPEWHRQVAEAYRAGFNAATTGHSTWWASPQGFHFVPDTNAQTANAETYTYQTYATGFALTREPVGSETRSILNETFPLNHPTPVACLDIEPEDL